MNRKIPAKRNLYFSMKISSLSCDGAYGYRYRLTDPLLQSAIRRHGILTPIIVSEDVRPVVIAGHKRLHAAKALKMKDVPVIVAKHVTPRDAFLLNLVSNWKQPCSEMDRVKALGRAERDFGFKERELLSEVMPLLGLPEDKATLELYLKFDRMPVSIKDLIDVGGVALRGAAFLLKFSQKDQEYFAAKIGSQVKLTSSQWLQTGEWLSDMMKRTGKSLVDFCRQSKVLEGLHVPGMDARTKADKFFACLKRLRSPNYSNFRERFEAKTSALLRDTKALRLEPVQGFEEPGFELHARVRTPGELDLLLQRIAEKRSALNSLFEIML